MNKKSNYFEIGGSLDFLDIDYNHPLIHNSSDKNLLNTIIYSTDIRSISNTYTKGNLADGIFNYDLFHSFVPAFLVIGFIYYYKKPLAFPMLAWPFHIVLDFPFHSQEYFPTKIIWPMSDFSFDGIPWSNPEVWFPNLAGLILLFIYRFRESFNSKN